MDFRECCVWSTKAVSASVMMMIRRTSDVSGCLFKYRVSAAWEKLFSDSKAFTKERVAAFFMLINLFCLPVLFADVGRFPFSRWEMYIFFKKSKQNRQAPTLSLGNSAIK